MAAEARAALARFAEHPASSDEVDELLGVLLRAVPEGEGRWSQIEHEFAHLAQEPLGRAQLKHRSKRLAWTPNHLNPDKGESRRKLSNCCNACGRCPRDSEKYKVCSNCHGVSYCSSSCQKQHWHLHKQQCKKQVKDAEHWSYELGKSSNETMRYLSTCHSSVMKLLEMLAWLVQHGMESNASPGPNLFTIVPRGRSKTYRKLLGLPDCGRGKIGIWLQSQQDLAQIAKMPVDVGGSSFAPVLELLKRVDINVGYLVSIIPQNNTNASYIRLRYNSNEQLRAMSSNMDRVLQPFKEFRSLGGALGGKFVELDVTAFENLLVTSVLEKTHCTLDVSFKCGDRVRLIGPTILGSRECIGQMGTVMCDVSHDGDYTVKVEGDRYCRSFFSSRLQLITCGSAKDEDSGLLAWLDSAHMSSATYEGIQLVKAYLHDAAAEANAMESTALREAAALFDSAVAETTTRSARIKPRTVWCCDTCCRQQDVDIECTWWEHYAHLGEWLQCDDCTLAGKSPENTSRVRRAILIQLCRALVQACFQCSVHDARTR